MNPYIDPNKEARGLDRKWKCPGWWGMQAGGQAGRGERSFRFASLILEFPQRGRRDPVRSRAARVCLRWGADSDPHPSVTANNN